MSLAFVVAVLAFGCVVCAALAWQALTDKGIQPYLEQYSQSGGRSDGTTARRRKTVPPSFFERRLRPWAIALAPRVGFLRDFVNEAELDQKLTYAGHPLDLDVEQFLGLKAVSALCFLGLGVLWWYADICLGPMSIVVFAVLGLLYPDLWLKRKIDERQTAITLALPDLMDLLSVCVQAGMGFDLALEHISRHMEGPLSDEVARFLHETRMGQPRGAALEGIARRNLSPDLRAFVGALIQADELGVPIADTLHAQAEEMRTRRSQRAREVAAKAGPQISLVTVLVSAPSAILLLGAVMVMYLLRNPGTSAVFQNFPK